MTQLWRSLLAFLFAHTQLARWMTHVFTCLCLSDQILADPNEADDNHSPEGRRMIESLIAGCEDWITFLINARAAELAGLRYTYYENPHTRRWAPHVERAWPDLMQRYQRMRLSFSQIERLARRQAARLKRDMAACPLRPDAPHQSSTLRVDPAALRAEEENRQRLFSVQISSSSAKHWGRWIARACAQDGGGSHARGPPFQLTPNSA